MPRSAVNNHAGYDHYSGQTALDFSPRQIFEILDFLEHNNISNEINSNTNINPRVPESDNSWVHNSIVRYFAYTIHTDDSNAVRSFNVYRLKDALLAILNDYRQLCACGDPRAKMPHVNSIELPTFDMLMLLILTDWYTNMKEIYPSSSWVKTTISTFNAIPKDELFDEISGWTKDDAILNSTEYEHLSSLYVLNTLKDCRLDEHNTLHKYHNPNKSTWVNTDHLSYGAYSFLTEKSVRKFTITEMLAKLGYCKEITTV